MTHQLRPIRDWEAARPENVIYDRFRCNDNQKVRKVVGRVKVMTEVCINGIYQMKKCYRKVHWDGFGHCFVGTRHARSLHSDIIFVKSGQ